MRGNVDVKLLMMMMMMFKSYLQNRKHYCVVHDVKSTVETIRCGVPQGSVLGPLLFLIYVNDIANVLQDNKLKLFADDTNLFLSSRSFHELEATANDCLSKMNDWFLANKLSLNVDKICYMLFSINRINTAAISLKLSINNQQILKVSTCKYLGIFLDEKLSFNAHIDYVYKKLVKFLSIFL